ncbi:potassium channel family protein [Lacipirellula sp.]|uniref:potassium channel family protein n=1 Tax=Lacipirellula sp. TaxID=2691419 RepID=UPI003D0ECB12
MLFYLSTFFGLALIFLALYDAFETLVLPRRVTRRLRIARVYFRVTWTAWRRLCDLPRTGRTRESLLSIFGPLSLFGLFICWMLLIVTGFALLHWLGHTLTPPSNRDFRQCLYHSGETFFTLGYGDVTPVTYVGKLLAVSEAGIGFGFMAVVIGYLPVLYQAFSNRERNITLLDARAGSPPTVYELWRRLGGTGERIETDRFLGEWEIWSAELLESHLSFPVLCYYRSQHDNQSWLAALALVLDAASLLLVHGIEGSRLRARLTFAMARHAAVDMCLVFQLPPREPPVERLNDEELRRCFSLAHRPLSDEQITQLRELQAIYEPFLQALADYFRLHLPRFISDRPTADNWQTSPWTSRAPHLDELSGESSAASEHFR